MSYKRNIFLAPEKQRTLVYGYIRQLKFLRRKNIPPSVFHICAAFYSCNLNLQFNIKDIGESQCTFETDRTKVTMNSNCVATADCTLSADLCKMVEWEIVVHKIGYYTYLGFLDAPLHISMPELKYYTKYLTFGQHVNHYALRIYRDWTYYNIRASNRENTADDIDISAETFGRNQFIDGDIFRFVVNFIDNVCDIYCNEKLLEKNAFKNFGRNIIPAVCSSGRTAIYLFRNLNIVY